MAIIQFDGVSKTYDGEGAAVEAVKDISFEVDRGEFVSVVGPSGCGKSTLLHLTTGIIGPTSGHIWVDGTDVQHEAHDKTNMGLVFQSPVLLEWRTVRDNIRLPIEIMAENDKIDGRPAEFDQRIDDLLELVGLSGFGDAYPQELSGGMQQRASICRSLVYDPKILLMDEPFGALDALTRENMNQELLRIWEETRKTIVFVTHNLDEAVYLSDRIVVLSSRPGEILDVFDIDLDRPRDQGIREEEDFQEHLAELYKHFRD